MFLKILTLSLCLSNAYQMENSDYSFSVPNFGNETPYNIHDWVKDLQLETCALVAIGLKYFAIFIENITDSEYTRLGSTKYFIGICHQSTLEEWTFCSENLSRKRKHKCKFKLRTDRYYGRVHRRFCDIRIMLNNKDCLCQSTIYGDEMLKVRGFPTCYIPPLPNTLCKYNVCGLSQCTPKSVENRVHTVECDPDCRGGNPFCEYPIDRSAKVPAVKSFWSKWRRIVDRGGFTKTIAEKLSVASCINTHTKKGDLDCLGPGLACCPGTLETCTCQTFEESGVLKVQRIIYEKAEEINKKSDKRTRDVHRHIRDTDDDIEDDDEEDDDIDEDIAIEEKTDEETTISTTEALEKEEMLGEFQEEAEKELKFVSNNNTLKKPDDTKAKSNCCLKVSGGLIIAINVVLINILLT